MRNHRIVLTALSLLVLLPLSGEAAVRTFVSALNGSDLNTCSRTQPCRTFAQALTETDSSGEIVVLDSGGYSPFTLNQPVTLIAPAGVHAAISPTSGVGLTINAGGAIVKIRGLALNGLGATDGLEVDNVGSLHLENVSVSGFVDNGLQFDSSGHLFAKDSAFRSNFNGIRVAPVANSTTVAVDNVVFEQNASSGFSIGNNVDAVVKNSIAVRNHNGYSCSGAATQMMVESSVAAHGTGGLGSVGVIASSGCVARVSNCTLINMTNGLQNLANGATVLSRGNNTIEDVDPFIGTIGTYSAR